VISWRVFGNFISYIQINIWMLLYQPGQLISANEFGASSVGLETSACDCYTSLVLQMQGLWRKAVCSFEVLSTVFSAVFVFVLFFLWVINRWITKTELYISVYLLRTYLSNVTKWVPYSASICARNFTFIISLPSANSLGLGKGRHYSHFIDMKTEVERVSRLTPTLDS